MKTTYVIDTNVILNNPNSINSFGSNDVVIPMAVIEEMDNFKKGRDELAFKARSFVRMLDSLQEKGSLNKGISLGEGRGVLKVVAEGAEGQELKNDNRILAVAVSLKGKRQKVVVVSEDINVRIKADALGLEARGFQEDVEEEELYTGVAEFVVPPDVISDFKNGHVLPFAEYGLLPNEFALLHSEEDPLNQVLGRLDGKNGQLRPVPQNFSAWGVTPRNMEQQCLFDLLMDPSIKLITVHGKSGSGKTMCALAAALEQVTEMGRFKKLLISRAVASVGAEMGFLPGQLSEKLEPWMMGFYDNLDQILQNRGKPSKSKKGIGGKPEVSLDDLIEQGIVGIECMSYIRGRSINDSVIILDECQNTTVKELQALITRAGRNTTIILLGDVGQIDVKGVDRLSCGLAVVTEKFKGQDLFGTITLLKGERSRLATLGSELL